MEGQSEKSLPELLNEFLQSSKRIEEKFDTFSEHKDQILSGFLEAEKGLSEKTQELRALSESIGRDISKEYQQNRESTRQLFEQQSLHLKSLSFNLSDKDRSSLQRAEELFKKWWKLPVLVSCASIVLLLISSYLTYTYYKESVRAKQEVRAEFLSQTKAKGMILVEEPAWNNLVEKQRVVEAWRKKKTKESKSLDDFIEGFETFKKTGK